MNQEALADDFIFDNQFLAQVVWKAYTIGEVSCPTKYFEEASSINFRRSVTYGLGCLRVSRRTWLARAGLVRPPVYLGRRGRRAGYPPR